jgi:hypothetical protein
MAKATRGLVVPAALAACALGCGSHPGTSGPTALSRDALLDPANCQGCHPSHYQDWAESMHAYAADDPVFVAMNRRGQRETGGQLGTFCVNCHAPMAVRDGLTTDGLNLDSLPPKYKGVTCFFCHSVASVNGSHNAALSLSTDDVMRGEYSNPAPGAAHASAYSPLLDGAAALPSAQVCGSCHDIVNPLGAGIERTFCEWSHSAFNAPLNAGGQTCAQCHMTETRGPIAQVAGVPVRNVHAHDFPAVDVNLSPGDAGATQARARVQRFLASSLQGAICVTQAGGVRVIVDPVFLGHDWPSGAAQDRRAWAEVVAYQGNNVVYQSGVVAVGGDVTAVMGDPDLWLLRDQMLDAQGTPVNMFWKGVSTKSNTIPALATYNQLDPRFYQTHVVQLYPRNMGVLPQMPDRVTFRLRLQPVGVDVLSDLATSGDIDPAAVAGMPTWDVSFLATDGSIAPGLEWTPQAATAAYVDEFDQTQARCVATGNFNIGANKVRAADPAPPATCPQ